MDVLPPYVVTLHTGSLRTTDYRTPGVNLYTVDVNVKTGHVCASKISIESSLPMLLLDWIYARLCLTAELWP